MSGTSVLKNLGIAIGAVLLIFVLFLWFWDFSRYKSDVEATVSDMTGREFRINGDFDVEVLPSPSVLIDGATLANADWSEPSAMVEVGHAYVRVGLWSLLFRPIVVHELEVSDVTVVLEAREDGTGNWQMGAPAEKHVEETEENEGDGESPIDLRSANVSNINLVYRQQESEVTEVAIDSFTVETDADARRQFDGSAQLSGTPVGLNGFVTGSHTELEANYGDVRFAASADRPDQSLDFTASLGSLASVGELIDVENLPAEDLDVEGNLRLRDGGLVISGMVASIPGMRLTLDGTLGGADGAAALKFGSEGESLSVFGADFPEIPFSASSDVNVVGDSIALSPITVAFGDSELRGNFEMDRGDAPVLRADVTSELLDLRPFASEEEPEEETAEPEEDETAGDAYVFGEDPLPLDTLRAMDAEISVTIGQILMASSKLDDLETTVTVKDGVLNVENRFNGDAGGDYFTSLQLAASSGETAELELKSDINDLKLGVMSGPDIARDEIPSTNVTLDLKGMGNSPRALAASVDGKILMTSGAGLVKNDLIDKFSGDIIAELFSALNPFAKEEEFTNWECSVFGLDFESGVGEITGFLLQSEKLTVVGGGEIDLNTEELNIEFNTKPRQGVGVSADMFVTPFVKLSGTLSSPSVGLNQKGLLLSGGAAVLTGGMSFLYQGLVDRATAEGSQCEQALESALAPAE